jgi:hypothetical protein
MIPVMGRLTVVASRNLAAGSPSPSPEYSIAAQIAQTSLKVVRAAQVRETAFLFAFLIDSTLGIGIWREGVASSLMPHNN